MGSGPDPCLFIPLEPTFTFGPQIVLVASPKGVGDGCCRLIQTGTPQSHSGFEDARPTPVLANSALYRKIEPPT